MQRIRILLLGKVADRLVSDPAVRPCPDASILGSDSSFLTKTVMSDVPIATQEPEDAEDHSSQAPPEV